MCDGRCDTEVTGRWSIRFCADHALLPTHGCAVLQSVLLLPVQVSVVGLLFLCGLYISSVCSGMGGIYGAPRILQCIASDGTIPIIRVLSKGVRWRYCVCIA